MSGRARGEGAAPRAQRALGATVAIKVAHSLYRRWEAMPRDDRERVRAFADEVKDRALALRGMFDRSSAEADLNDASERLAGEIVGSAQADPAIDDAELERLRGELARELARLSQQRRAA